MRIREYRNHFVDTLAPIYDLDEAESFFYLVLEDKKQWKRIDLALNPEAQFSEIEIPEWNEILEKLKQYIPIQYILGKTHFYGLEFEVNENVLIPRPETEELVEWILSNNCKSGNLKILDIGTGSGCIAISLAKNLPAANISAIDVSEKALATAQKNAQTNEVKVDFLRNDILKTEDLEQQFDIIVSNPPYVRNLEKEEIRQNVLEHEPHLALFVDDDDALIFYRKIAELAQKNLSPNGQLYFEINQYLGKEMMDLLEQKNFQQMELRKDIYGNHRMVFGRK
ncbi:release factor glutamine methyltransferase [Flavobacterium noncentrifugens]|uniref:Release factor glutamine methyltransferase n=1 Tax=Flavobacterium noncentrifugens TaxID=1128970 RepID=A0A1G9CP37_9FLAO|nr:peptide chain release factor N(5)-glutamine methyltransferase [Flavobacterium noncentrifugens]GEP52106.1 release factor glutamine methyltransferase [Flavobacterium noncentrifugens]SDK53412.1 release factor glutamine methyltransferase [Flavobacterium noncentrifugens]